MIPFEEIDTRLAGIGKNRIWLAGKSGRKPDSIRVALAPNAPKSKRSELLQKALTDAIEGEERCQREAEESAVQIPTRISIRAMPKERESWEECSLAAQLTLNSWIVAQLNDAASKWQEQEGKEMSYA